MGCRRGRRGGRDARTHSLPLVGFLANHFLIHGDCPSIEMAFRPSCCGSQPPSVMGIGEVNTLGVHASQLNLKEVQRGRA